MKKMEKLKEDNYVKDSELDRIISEKLFELYIEKDNDEEFIIETNGSQHYRAEFERLGGRSFEEECKNDVYKEELAQNNNINYYIKFECSESNKIHMINAIYNSIFHVYFENEGIFNNINFEQCDYFATNNSTFRDIYNMWNSSKTITTTDIANNLNLDIV